MLPSHGANPQILYEQLGISMPEQVIDFSENSYAGGPPDRVKENWLSWLQAASHYPDPNGSRLKKLIAEKHHVREKQVLLGNGAAELMMTVLRLFRDREVGVIHPAFSEYERVIQANGAEAIPIYTNHVNGWLPDSAAIHTFLSKPDRALFICNPNNPTGVRIPKHQLLDWLGTAEKYKNTILLDEAFIDMAGDEYSLDDQTGSPALIIFRSMTKMYSLAGLRLGYLLADESIIRRVKDWLPHWNVNAIALLAGEEVLKDEEYTRMVRKETSAERTRIQQALIGMGFRITQSEANYVLFQPPDPVQTEELWRSLLEKGLVLRHTWNYQQLEGRWLRSGIKAAEQNTKLLEALATWVQ
ncbi:threonine-phosphate decarboxylase CobD [Jeotgalibacillus sp. R-1-5s-1]|uniref:threonine-phosphate decarboxylase CobD n=1 Tax=Jeotgalibacillus sp. R-1-5s-1 TaxID=2555897 RepID=UPI001FC8DD0F|nr:threonine-phosphate decarboxylase CobD [Jeotgalibacillus sp. R-1-5s-1]